MLAFAFLEGLWQLNGRNQNCKEEAQQKEDIVYHKSLSVIINSQDHFFNGFRKGSLLDFDMTVLQCLQRGAEKDL